MWYKMAHAKWFPNTYEISGLQFNSLAFKTIVILNAKQKVNDNLCFFRFKAKAILVVVRWDKSIVSSERQIIVNNNQIIKMRLSSKAKEIKIRFVRWTLEFGELCIQIIL